MSPATRTSSRIHRLCLAGAALTLLAASAGATAIAAQTTPIRTVDTDADPALNDGSFPLTGVVLGADGRPVTDASVTLRVVPQVGGNGLPAKPEITRTGKDGRFTSGERVGRRFDLRVEAQGHAFRTYRELVASEPLTVTLEAGHPLSGRVLAKTTGEGIAGLRVEIDDGEQFELRGGGGLETTTDNEGRYRFLHAPAGKVWLRASGPGWARRSIHGEVRPELSGDAPTALDDLWLPEGGEVSGRVADAKGRSVVGAFVVVMSVDLERDGHRQTFPTMRTRTDETGGYAFEGVTAGARYLVRAKHDAFSPGVAGPFAVGAGTLLDDVDLTLGRGATLRLRLVDAEQQPCTRVTLRIESEEDARTDLAFQQWVLSTEDGGVETGDEGWLTVRKLAPGRYSVWIEPDDRVGLRRENVLLAEGETADLGTMALETGSVVRGRVVEEGGSPVAGAEVALGWRNMSGSYDRDAVTDAAGRFSVGGLPGHALALTVSAEGFAKQTLEKVTPGADDVAVTLLRRGGIRGTVKLAGGAAASAFSVRVHDEHGVSTPSPGIEIGAGSFAVHDLDPGPYGVEIRASAKAPGRIEKVAVRSGDITDVGEIVLRTGLVLEGRVLIAAAGLAVAGATVRVDRGSGPSRWTRETGQLVAVSDAHGNFYFDELDAGRSTLSLFHPEFAPVLQSLDLERGSLKTRIVIELTGGGEIRGVVRDSDGLPAAGAALTVYRGMRGFDLRQTVTAEDGSFRFPRLAPGTYIVLRTPRARSPFNQQVRTVDVREGQVTEVKFAEPQR